MHLKHFGDSYDIVKQSLLQWLTPLGPWSAHPMFTHDVQAEAAEAFGRFLGVPLLSRAVLHRDTDRGAYFACVKTVGNVFLDPDTGVRMTASRKAGAPKFVFGPELAELCRARPTALTLVFDQSISRQGDAAAQAGEKLRDFAMSGVRGFAYVSHACFLVLGTDPALVGRGHEAVLSASRLPAGRLVSVQPI